ncbi:MAG TPA: hypothetical protein VE689_08685 [Candidatus Udaeobacter sp.]|nr:hypothetical protein [Candidatus Udaeobacter sp.]
MIARLSGLVLEKADRLQSGSYHSDDLARVLADFVRRHAESAKAEVDDIAEVQDGNQPEFFSFLYVSDIERRGIDGPAVSAASRSPEPPTARVRMSLSAFIPD